MVKKIALIGASADQKKFGYRILKDLIAKGFQVYPVNPGYDCLEELKCYHTVSELPSDIDLLVFVIPPQKALPVVLQALEKNFKNFWFQPGASDDVIGNLLEQHPGVSLVMNRCIMVETDHLKT